MSVKMKDDGLMRIMGKSKMKRLEKSKPDAERDSGFSDASSEHLSTVDQTDTDDTSRPVLPVARSRSQPSQLAVMSGSLQNLSPMIIMNNVLLKQPGDNQSSLKPWGFRPAVEVVQQPRVVFLQPVVSQRAAAVPKGPPNKRRRHKKYLPILKSYPKIAPHPGDSPHGICSNSGSSSTAALVKSCNLSSSSQDRTHGDKQQGLPGSASSASTTPNHLMPTRHLPASLQPHMAVADSNTSPDCEGSAPGNLEPPAVPTDTHTKALQTHAQEVSEDCIGQDSDSDGSNKRKRFCNTYNILSKSGLLDITLRTKELIRQNRRTQAELDLLRQHTSLFMEALQTGDLHMWSKLQLRMQEDSDMKTVNNGSEMQVDQLK
ncbi:CLOCK-interacting pacemaker [Brachyhypopomus gauderio]|uniref:CLOCK-interacting pacemaker n=1 Tax=Brachyhypopomus gauderio TaxID=698409 RepID=UPI0040430823